MTYSEWADEYLKSANDLKEKINNLKAERKTAPISKLQEINSRIHTLYSMYLDCMATANILRRRKGVAF